MAANDIYPISPVPPGPAPSSAPAGEYKYWAFFSYSHRDAKVANWLHAQLETYRVPQRLVGRQGRGGATIPRRVFPIFRDREELPSSSSLDENLVEALRRSRYLIVLCSPAATASRWVNQEIRTFKMLGGSNRILCVILDGEPNASEHPGSGLPECFPEALRHPISPTGDLLRDHYEEPIAADLRPGGDGRHAVKLKLMAGMLGVDFDELNQREKQRERRRWVTAGAGLLGFLLLCAAAAFWTWNQYYREHIEYFAFLKKVNVDFVGIPPAIDPATRDESWKVIRHGVHGPPEVLEHVDAHGQPVVPMIPEILPLTADTIKANIVKIVLFHNAEGRVIEEKGLDLHGNSILDAQWLTPNSAIYQVDGKVETRGTSGVSRVETIRPLAGPMAGLDIYVAFTDAEGNPKPTNPGFYALSLDYDAQGRPIKIVALGADKKPVATEARPYAVTAITYDRDGNRDVTETTNPEGVSSPAAFKSIRVKETFDARGTFVQSVTTCQPLPGKGDQPVVWTTKLDRAKQQMITAYDLSGIHAVIHGFLRDEPQRMTADFGFAGYNVFEDKQGRLVGLGLTATDGTSTHPKPFVLRALPEDAKPKAALEPGDVILGYNGRPVADAGELASLTSLPDGAPRELRVVREGKLVVLSVPAGPLGFEVKDTL